MRIKKPHPAGETGQGLEMSGRRCGSPDIQLNFLVAHDLLGNRYPLFRVMRVYSITCTIRRVRGSTSTVAPFTTV